MPITAYSVKGVLMSLCLKIILFSFQYHQNVYLCFQAVGKQGRVINGEKAPEEQPYLFSGGVLREYQMEGFKWLKVVVWKVLG